MNIHLEFSNSNLAHRFRQAGFGVIEPVHAFSHLPILDGKLRKLLPDAEIIREQGHLFTFNATSLQDLVLVSPEHHCPPFWKVSRSRRCRWKYNKCNSHEFIAARI
jgi:hypothetical protein